MEYPLFTYLRLNQLPSSHVHVGIIRPQALSRRFDDTLTACRKDSHVLCPGEQPRVLVRRLPTVLVRYLDGFS